MKSTTCVLISAVFLIAGCGRGSAPTKSNDQAPQRVVDGSSTSPGRIQNEEGKEVAWKTSLLEGGYMFQNAQVFGAYVHRAQIVATGVLTDWDGTKGNVQLDSVLHGTANDKSVPVVATGGIVRTRHGDKVLFLLAPRDGELKLHSFCGASGMYIYSDDLASVIRKSLRSRG